MTETPETPIVDRDAGEDYGVDLLPLRRPFRLGGVDYGELTVKVPSGADMLAHVDPARGKRDGVGLILALGGITAKIWDALYAGDRGALDTTVGRHIGARPKPKPAPVPEVADLDAKAGYGADEVILARPFRHRGMVYKTIRLRVPNGRDVSRYVDILPVSNAVSLDLLGDLAELSADVFQAMYAGDLAELQAVVGKHL